MTRGLIFDAVVYVFQTSYLIVDDMYAKLPKLVEDKFWNKPVVDVPYTKDSEQFRVPEFEGSALANPK